MDDFRTLLSQQMQSVGLSCPSDLQVCGNVVRFKNGSDPDESSWYALHQEGEIIYGGFGCWRLGIVEPFCTRKRHDCSKGDWLKIQQAIGEAKQKHLQEEARRQSVARQRAASILADSTPLDGHGYLLKKKIQAHGNLSEYKDMLVLPLVDESGAVQSLQLISHDGTKKFLTDGKTKGCFFELASPSKFRGPLYISEGLATGATVHEATNCPQWCAMNAGNLPIVAQIARKRYPELPIIIAADNDQMQSCKACNKPVNVNQHKEVCPSCGKPHLKKNSGLLMGRQAEKLVNGALVYPQFPEQLLSKRPSDFNDVWLMSDCTLEAVRRQLFASMNPEKKPAFIHLIEREFDSNSEPPQDQILYTLAGKRFGSVGNLSTIVAQAKTGKTALLGAMMASVMAGEDADTFRFKAENPNGDYVLHFDTEQSRADHWYCGRRVMKRAMIERKPGWFKSYALKGLNTVQMWACVEEATKGRNIHSMFLDGVADFVLDVNDPKECNAFVAKLMHMSDLLRCHIVCILHLNPGTEKSRGHLGSELERKSETNLRLEKQDDGTTVAWSDRQRGAPISKSDGVSFRWDDEAQMHVSHSPKTEDGIADDVLACLPDGGMYEPQWLKEARGATGLSDAKLKKIFKQLEKDERAYYSKAYEKWTPNLKKR